nr:helix-turn-helix transcriptional regulator [uncultured Albidiferax sp.]
MNTLVDSAILQRQLLLQLGDRLRRLRKARKLSTVEAASRVGISRTTLSAVEAGDPAPSIGTYLRVMSLLGVGSDLALLAGDVLHPAPADSAAARSLRSPPQVQVMVMVTTDPTRHQAQDLQSLVLHEEAVRRVRADPALLQQAQDLLQTWLSAGNHRSTSLWLEWKDILEGGQWRKALGRTRRAQELRQASPLTPVLPPAVRERILAELGSLKKGIVLGQEPAP